MVCPTQLKERINERKNRHNRSHEYDHVKNVEYPGPQSKLEKRRNPFFMAISKKM